MYFDVPPALALERNELRKRRVPREVIRKMYETMQSPTMAEGFDEVKNLGVTRPIKVQQLRTIDA